MRELYLPHLGKYKYVDIPHLTSDSCVRNASIASIQFAMELLQTEQ